MLETDYAAAACAWYEQAGWEPFFEVTMPGGDGERADLVLLRDGLLMVAEVKRVLSNDLIAQAKKWKPYANAVSIVVPYAQPTQGRTFTFQMAEHYVGLGVLEISGPGSEHVREVASPRRLERLSDDLLDSLRPEHKTAKAPGTPGGGQHTGFKVLVGQVREFVMANQGCTIDEAILGVCGRPNTTLARMLRRGEVPGVTKGLKQRLIVTEEEVENG